MNTLCRFTKVINLGYGMTNLDIHSSIAHSSVHNECDSSGLSQNKTLY